MTAEQPKRRRDGSLVAMPLPARGGTRTRPPFEKGNELSTTHGAYSKRKVAERAEQVRELLLEHAPELASPLWDEARREYCWALAKVELIRESVAGTVAEKGDIAHVRPTLLQELTRSETLADRLRGELGLTPRSAAMITRDLNLAHQGRRNPTNGPQLGEAGRALRIARGRGPDDFPK